MTVHNCEYSVVFNRITSTHEDKKMYLSPRFVFEFSKTLWLRHLWVWQKTPLYYWGKSGLVQGPDLYKSVYSEIIFNMDEKHLQA